MQSATIRLELCQIVTQIEGGWNNRLRRIFWLGKMPKIGWSSSAEGAEVPKDM